MNLFLSLILVLLIIKVVKYAIQSLYGCNSFLENPEVLLIAGGFDGDSILNSVELYSPGGSCNFEISPLPERLYGLFCFTYNEEVYCCGGDVRPRTTCYHYNLQKNGIGEWEKDEVKTLNFPRFFSAVDKIPETGVVVVR